MKKIIFFLAFVCVGTISAQAQIEINAYGGYVPGSKTSYSYNGYRLRIDGGGNFGVGISKVLPTGMAIELGYSNFQSTLKQDGGIIDIVKPQDITVEYYQLGVLKPLMEGETFIPYGLFSLGASRFAPKEENEDHWRFAINAGLGMKYFLSDKVGIRIQARLLMPLYFQGAGFGCSIGTGGSGCGTGIGMGSEIIQADFTGGIVLRVGQ
ncbi:MAG: porin family protein [Cyclobacteriaceae bacterium]|nr:porin family protein [Cyclobacteriaceae bacterium]